MKGLVEYRSEGAIGIITVNNPPVNAVSSGVPQGILNGLLKGSRDQMVKAFVLMGAGKTFVAGADIRELENLQQADGLTLRDLLPLLEECEKPIIAAIHGTALGGGLEIALCCHFRCALPTARLGLPEVKLGLLPGAGGTQRLPRLIGVEAALDMALTGDHIGAEKALELGLVDEILGGDLIEGALEFAERVLAEKRPLRVVSQMTAPLSAPCAVEYFQGVRQHLEVNAKGQLAPFLIVDSVQNAVELPFAEGWAHEEQLFWRCMDSPQSKVLMQKFFEKRTSPKSASA